MTYVFTRRNQPRIVQMRGFLLPTATRGGRHQQMATYQAECACGWHGHREDTDTSARREAMTHVCPVQS